MARVFIRASLVNMAENNEGDTPRATEIHSSLVQARDIIVQLLDGVGTSPQNPAVVNNNNPVARGTAGPAAFTYSVPHGRPVERSPQAPSNNRVLEEHRRLFGFSGQNIGERSYARSSAKRSKSGGKNAKITKRATWTHAFVCLSKKRQIYLPSPKERYELKCAGLGEKKISIEIDGTGFEKLYRLLLEEFPLLSNAGGIELMRTGFGQKSKTLEVIPVPFGSSSYSVEYLKDVLMQAKCYVRPIQRDLPKQIVMEDIQDSTTGLYCEVRFYTYYILVLLGTTPSI